jgi:hypothetical protein
VALVRARTIGEVGRTPRFDAAWDTLYRNAFPDVPGLAGALIARNEAMVIRLALIYCLLDGRNNLDLPHLVAAYAAWMYCEDSARFIFGERLGNDIEQQLLDEARAVAPEGLDRTAQSDLFGRHASAGRIEIARSALIERGLCREERFETTGRPRFLLFSITGEKRAENEISPCIFHLNSLLSLNSLRNTKNGGGSDSDETII